MYPRVQRVAGTEALERECRRLAALETRCEALRLRRLLSAWGRAAALRMAKRLGQARAERHWRGVAGRALLAGLGAGVPQRIDPRQQEIASGRLRRVRLSCCFRVSDLNMGPTFAWHYGDGLLSCNMMQLIPSTRNNRAGL